MDFGSTFYFVSNRIEFSMYYTRISKKSRKTVKFQIHIKNLLNWENVSSCRCIKTQNISYACQITQFVNVTIKYVCDIILLFLN
jgi:hypothetical protein